MPSLGSSDNSVNVVINTKADTKGVDKAHDSIGKLKKGFSDAIGPSKALAATMVALGAGMVVFGKKSVDAYFDAQQSMTKLRTNMLNVKGATEANVDSLSRLADHLQSVGVIEDDTIRAGMSQLATFNLQSKTIETLTPKIADMVAQLKGHNATAEDMVAINNLVGKVMTGNVGALSRYGVTLSETQKKQLQSGTETERAAVLNQVLAQNYGKVNEALRKTPQGKITGLKNAFNDLQEGLGQVIVEGLTPLVNAFDGWIKKVQETGGFVEYFSKLLKDNQLKVAMLAGAITVALIPAIASFGAALGLALWQLKVFLVAGAVIGAIVYKLSQHFGGFGNMLNTVGTALSGVFTTVYNMLKPSLDALGNTLRSTLLPALQQFWNIAAPLLLPVLKALAILIGGTLIGALYLGINVINLFAKSFSFSISIIAAVISMIRGFYNATAGIRNAVIHGVSGISEILQAPFNAAFKALGGIMSRIVGMWTGVGGMIRKAIGNVDIPGPLGKIKDVIPGFAMGTYNAPGGTALVGERGPELVSLPKGSQVHTAAETRNMLTEGGSNTTITIQNMTLDASGVRRFFEMQDRNGILAGKGLSTVRL